LAPPTASVGHLLNPGDVLEYTGDLTQLNLIETTASASVTVTYFN
jgi:hypothetical protein